MEQAAPIVHAELQDTQVLCDLMVISTLDLKGPLYRP